MTALNLSKLDAYRNADLERALPLPHNAARAAGVFDGGVSFVVSIDGGQTLVSLSGRASRPGAGVVRRFMALLNAAQVEEVTDQFRNPNTVAWIVEAKGAMQ